MAPACDKEVKLRAEVRHKSAIPTPTVVSPYPRSLDWSSLQREQSRPLLRNSTKWSRKIGLDSIGSVLETENRKFQKACRRPANASAARGHPLQASHRRSPSLRRKASAPACDGSLRSVGIRCALLRNSPHNPHRMTNTNGRKPAPNRSRGNGPLAASDRGRPP